MTAVPAATILVVEDEALLREVTVMELEDAGYRVLAAPDAKSALALLAGPEPISLLFTDISLRDSIDGWTVASEARGLRPGLPVIYATGYSPDIPRLVEGGRFFKKPYLPSAVIAMIEEMIGAT